MTNKNYEIASIANEVLRENAKRVADLRENVAYHEKLFREVCISLLISIYGIIAVIGLVASYNQHFS